MMESLADYADKLSVLDNDIAKNWLDEIVQKKVGNRPLFLWGSGGRGIKVLNTLRSLQKQAYGFIDSDMRKQGTNIEGVRVYPPQHLSELKKIKESPYIIIASMCLNEISTELIKMGFILDRDFFTENLL
jgi:FlaA1/EpsC-like NDP-sugar epimerase